MYKLLEPYAKLVDFLGEASSKSNSLGSKNEV